MCRKEKIKRYCNGYKSKIETLNKFLAMLMPYECEFDRKE